MSFHVCPSAPRVLPNIGPCCFGRCGGCSHLFHHDSFVLFTPRSARRKVCDTNPPLDSETSTSEQVRVSNNYRSAYGAHVSRDECESVCTNSLPSFILKFCSFVLPRRSVNGPARHRVGTKSTHCPFARFSFLDLWFILIDSEHLSADVGARSV